MIKKGFIKNSLILTGFSLCMRISGVVFGMFIAAQVGAECMGLYQLTLSAFVFALTVATAGISVAVTRVLTVESGRGTRATSGR
jgi:stage V sporulation protein B